MGVGGVVGVVVAVALESSDLPPAGDSADMVLVVAALVAAVALDSQDTIAADVVCMLQ